MRSAAPSNAGASAPSRIRPFIARTNIPRPLAPSARPRTRTERIDGAASRPPQQSSRLGVSVEPRAASKGAK